MAQSISIQNSKALIESRFRTVEAIQTEESRFGVLLASIVNSGFSLRLERAFRAAACIAVTAVWFYTLMCTLDLINRLLLSMQTLAL